MKFMFIVKSAQAAAPTPKLLEEMHKLANREIKAGRMLDNGGLMPIAMKKQSSRRSSSCSFTRITCQAGKEPARSARSRREVLRGASFTQQAAVLLILGQ
jgi:hypothetical protein